MTGSGCNYSLLETQVPVANSFAVDNNVVNEKVFGTTKVSTPAFFGECGFSVTAINTSCINTLPETAINRNDIVFDTVMTHAIIDDDISFDTPMVDAISSFGGLPAVPTTISSTNANTAATTKIIKTISSTATSCCELT